MHHRMLQLFGNSLCKICPEHIVAPMDAMTWQWDSGTDTGRGSSSVGRHLSLLQYTTAVLAPMCRMSGRHGSELCYCDVAAVLTSYTCCVACAELGITTACPGRKAELPQRLQRLAY